MAHYINCTISDDLKASLVSRVAAQADLGSYCPRYSEPTLAWYASATVEIDGAAYAVRARWAIDLPADEISMCEDPEVLIGATDWTDPCELQILAE